MAWDRWERVFNVSFGLSQAVQMHALAARNAQRRVPPFIHRADHTARDLEGTRVLDWKESAAANLQRRLKPFINNVWAGRRGAWSSIPRIRYAYRRNCNQLHEYVVRDCENDRRFPHREVEFQKVKTDSGKIRVPLKKQKICSNWRGRWILWRRDWQWLWAWNGWARKSFYGIHLTENPRGRQLPVGFWRHYISFGSGAADDTRRANSVASKSTALQGTD